MACQVSLSADHPTQWLLILFPFYSVWPHLGRNEILGGGGLDLYLSVRLQLSPNLPIKLAKSNSDLRLQCLPLVLQSFPCRGPYNWPSKLRPYLSCYWPNLDQTFMVYVPGNLLSRFQLSWWHLSRQHLSWQHLSISGVFRD